MNTQKFLFCASALSGLLMATASVAEPVGANAFIKSAKIVCTATMTGDVPLFTVPGATQQKGIESSWLITNTSHTIPLKITKIDSYGMDGKLLTSVTPASAPDLKTETAVSGAVIFDWTVEPHQLVRFPHDYTMVYPVNGVGGTSPSLVQWYNVVISVESGIKGKAISAPTVTTAMVERTEDLKVTPKTNFVLSRTRNDCKYMM